MRDQRIHISTIIDVSRKLAGLRMVLSIARSRSGKSLNVSRVVASSFNRRRLYPLGTLPLSKDGCVSYTALSKLLRGE